MPSSSNAAKRAKSVGSPDLGSKAQGTISRLSAGAAALQAKAGVGRRTKSTGPLSRSPLDGNQLRPPPLSDGPEDECAPLCGLPYCDVVSKLGIEKQRFSEAPVIGFQNNGNMCFLNAVLQSLVHTPLLRHLLAEICPRPKEEWLGEVAGLYRNVEWAKSNGAPISASKIAGMLFLASTTDEFQRGAQADAHEALMLIISKLLEGCLTMTGFSEPSLSFAEKEQLERGSLLGHVFGMDVASCVRCNSCSYESTTTRVEYCLCISCTLGMSDKQLETLQKSPAPKSTSRFPLRSTASTTNYTVPDTTLEALLKQFIKSETIAEFKCEKCANKGCTRTASVANPPNVLIVNVYRRQGNGVFGKINRTVKFKERLDLTPFVGGDAPGSMQYQLYAVIVHKEVNKMLGHYVAYVRDQSGQWHLLDDTRVEAVSWSHVAEQDAYMLLYECNDILPPKVQESDGSSTSTSPGNGSSWSSSSSADSMLIRLEDVKERAADHVKKKEFEAAAALWSEAIELQPKDADLCLSRASSLRQLRKWDAAEAEAIKALAIDPRSTSAFHAQAQALHRMGKLTKALERCKAGLDLKTGDKALLHLKGIVEQAQKISELRKRAADHAQKKEFAASVEIYTEALSLQARDLNSLLGRAGANVGLGRWEDARRDSDSALELNSKNVKALLSRAVALRHLALLAPAAKACKAGLAEQPRDVALQEELALIERLIQAVDARQLGQKHLDSKEFEDAIVSFGQAIALHDQDYRARLGRAHAYAGLSHWEAAEADAQHALELPVAPTVQEQECEEHRAEVVEASSWRADAHLLLASALRHRDQISAAVSACEAGLRDAPEQPVLLQLRAQLLEPSRQDPTTPESVRSAGRRSNRRSMIVSL